MYASFHGHIPRKARVENKLFSLSFESKIIIPRVFQFIFGTRFRRAPNLGFAIELCFKTGYCTIPSCYIFSKLSFILPYLLILFLILCKLKIYEAVYIWKGPKRFLPPT